LYYKIGCTYAPQC